MFINGLICFVLQADEGRHIEELATKVKVIAEAVCSRCLLLGDHTHMATVAKIQGQLTSVNKCLTTGNRLYTFFLCNKLLMSPLQSKTSKTMFWNKKMLIQLYICKYFSYLDLNISLHTHLSA